VGEVPSKLKRRTRHPTFIDRGTSPQSPWFYWLTSQYVEDFTMTEQTAELYRMVLPDHVCPFGVDAKQMLEQAGFKVDETILHSRDEVDALKAKLGVDTTPQVFIDGERIGGSDALRLYLAA